jgi:hypothetical protein
MSTVVQTQAFGTPSTVTPGTNTWGTLPTNGNGVLVLVGYDANFSPGVGTGVTDNQTGSPNTYTLIKAEPDANSGDSCTSEAWWCPSVVVNAGTFVVNVAYTGTMGAQVCLVEINAWKTVIDQTGGQNSGGAVSSTVTAAGANTNAHALVVAMCKTGFGASALSDPPTTGYTSLSTGTGTGGGAPVEAAYKIVSSIETSAASWTWTTSEANASLIFTIGQLPVGPTATIAWVK